MCHHIFMYKRRDKNTNFYVVHIAQTSVQLNTYQTYMEVWCKVWKKLLVTKPITFITIT